MEKNKFGREIGTHQGEKKPPGKIDKRLHSRLVSKFLPVNHWVCMDMANERGIK